MGNPLEKIYLSGDKYLYQYQLGFIRLVANTEKLSSFQFKEVITEMLRYNFVSDFIEGREDCGGLVWDSDNDEICFELFEDCGIFEALIEAGFSVYP